MTVFGVGTPASALVPLVRSRARRWDTSFIHPARGENVAHPRTYLKTGGQGLPLVETSPTVPGYPNAVIVAAYGCPRRPEVVDESLWEALGGIPGIVRWGVTVPTDLVLEAAAGLPVGDQVVENVFRWWLGYPCRRFRYRGGLDGLTGSPRHPGYPFDADAVGEPILVHDYSSRRSGSHS